MTKGLALALTTALLAGCAALSSASPEKTVTMHLIDAEGIGEQIGTVSLEDGSGGLVLSTDLSGLPPGPHGLHVHQNPNCGPQEQNGRMTPGLAAGGHYDPTNTGRHSGPGGSGHLGDLPVLTVAQDGTAEATLTAPRLKLADVLGRSLMIHAGGDNFADQPQPLGGGGGRIACGVIR